MKLSTLVEHVQDKDIGTWQYVPWDNFHAVKTLVKASQY